MFCSSLSDEKTALNDDDGSKESSHNSLPLHTCSLLPLLQGKPQNRSGERRSFLNRLPIAAGRSGVCLTLSYASSELSIKDDDSGSSCPLSLYAISGRVISQLPKKPPHQPSRRCPEQTTIAHRRHPSGTAHLAHFNLSQPTQQQHTAL